MDKSGQNIYTSSYKINPGLPWQFSALSMAIKTLCFHCRGYGFDPCVGN